MPKSTDDKNAQHSSKHLALAQHNKGKAMQAISNEHKGEEPEIEKVPIAIGLPVFIGVLILLVYLGFWANQWLRDEQRLPVQEIIFSGNIKMLNEDDLANAIKTNLSSSFFALDVNDVHTLMESQSWVYSASIRKRWPSKLYIHIIEQNAVAVWNSDLLLNQYGDIFDDDGLYFSKLASITASAAVDQSNDESGQASNIEIEQATHTDKLRALPQLFGPGGSEKMVLKGYTDMQRLLNTSQLQIEELVLSERFAWQAQLNNKVRIQLGRESRIDRLQRFIDVYPLLIEQDKSVDYVDLRYDTGLAVGWMSDMPKASTNNNNT